MDNSDNESDISTDHHVPVGRKRKMIKLEPKTRVAKSKKGGSVTKAIKEEVQVSSETILQQSDVEDISENEVDKFLMVESAIKEENKTRRSTQTKGKESKINL